MLQAIVQARVVLAMTVAAAVGTWGLHAYPVRLADDLFLQMIFVRKPGVFHVLVVRLRHAVVHDAVPRRVAGAVAAHHRRLAPCPVASRSVACRRIPRPSTGRRRRSCSAKRTSRRKPGRAPAPSWLTIPQRGLYTGVMILGAVGTGKTSACMYPYVDQLLRWRAGDADRKVGGLRPRGEGRLLQAGARHPGARRPRRRLPRDRPRRRRLLQPAAQRPRPVRRGLRHRLAAEQPVRQVEGAVLAAGVHRPAEVRHPAAPDHRRLHHACPRSTATSSTTARSTATSAG